MEVDGVNQLCHYQVHAEGEGHIGRHQTVEVLVHLLNPEQEIGLFTTIHMAMLTQRAL